MVMAWRPGQDEEATAQLHERVYFFLLLICAFTAQKARTNWISFATWAEITIQTLFRSGLAQLGEQLPQKKRTSCFKTAGVFFFFAYFIEKEEFYKPANWHRS